jgi:hypothetical protein
VREILSLVIYALAVYGLANAIAVLKIGRYFFGQGYCKAIDCVHENHPHELRRGLGRIPYAGDVFYCPPCIAFWIGVAGSKWVLSPAAVLVDARWKSILLDGLLASAVTYIAHVVMERTGKELDL